MAKGGFTTWRSLIEYSTDRKVIHLLPKKQIIYRKCDIKTQKCHRFDIKAACSNMGSHVSYDAIT